MTNNIDIEKLAKDCGVIHYDHLLTQNGERFLKQFAEAYHKAKIEQAVNEEHETPIAYIENLEREIAKLKTTVRSDNSKVIAALQAHINDLREALEDIRQHTFDLDAAEVGRQALSKTPAQSMTEHDNELLEQVISTIESMNIDAMFKPVSFSDMYVAIRALKQEVK